MEKHFFKKINFLYVSTILTMIIMRFAFYRFIGFFSKFTMYNGFLFDVLIDVSLVFLLFFIFKSHKARQIVSSTLLGVYVVIFFFDYVYYRTFTEFGSASAIIDIIFVDVGEYGLVVDWQMLTLLFFYGQFMFFNLKYTPQQVAKRNKWSLAFIPVLLIPFAYGLFIYFQIPSFESDIQYVQSKAAILVNPQWEPKKYIEYFGYSVFRYEDLVSYIQFLLGIK